MTISQHPLLPRRPNVLGLAKNTPTRRTRTKRSPPGALVESIPRLGGLHHPYTVATQGIDASYGIQLGPRGPSCLNFAS